MIDDIDRKILRVLERDGRVSNAALADRVGLSASACLRRVQQLERDGVISGYRASLNPESVDRGFLAYIAVGLSSHTKTSQEAFERQVARAPEVREVHNITGSVEYLLRVECSDLASYKAFHTDRLGTIEHVASITTYVVLESPKDERS